MHLSTGSRIKFHGRRGNFTSAYLFHGGKNIFKLKKYVEEMFSHVFGLFHGGLRRLNLRHYGIKIVSHQSIITIV